MGAFGAACVFSACGDDDPPSSTDTGIDADVGGDVDTGPPWERIDYEYDGPMGPEDLFQHGVASGDPVSDAVILWTRVTPDADAPVEVFFEVATDPGLENQVLAGYVETSADVDFTVKVDAIGLPAATTLYYRFQALGRPSRIGRTRTAPRGPADALRIAVMACSSYAHGYFNGYRLIAERHDIDLCVHCGDYIYEYGNGSYGNARELDPPHEIVTLEDYRRRYAHYRRDEDLQEMHRQHPMTCVWDDHEIADNTWKDGAGNHGDQEGPWEDRLSAAQQAYWEWMPIRVDDPSRIFRALPYGDLLDVIMLDTRTFGRDKQVIAQEERFEPGRTLLGAEQRAWFEQRLTESTATWKLVGQQVIMSQWFAVGASLADGGGDSFNLDGWDGYADERNELLRFMGDSGVDGVVVVTGDVHTTWAFDLTDDPYDPDRYDPETGEGAVGVELVSPGITSPFPDGIGELLGPLFEMNNPQMHFYDLEYKGYWVLDFTAERMRADAYHLEDISEQNRLEFRAATLECRAGENRLRVVEDETPSRDPREPAPD